MSGTKEKIVVRSVNWLGDAVMSTSALQRLREARPDAHITLLSHEKLADLWKNQPFADDVMVFTSEETPLQIGRRLRWGNFSTGLILPNSPRTGLEMWFGKIPKRIGYARPWRNLFLTHKIPPRSDEVKTRKRSFAEVQRLISSGNSARERFPASAHHVHMYLHLVATAFAASPSPLPPRIVVLDREVDAFKRRFEISESDLPILGLNPGAEYGPAKRWPKERFISTAVELSRQLKCRWLLFGGKSDQSLADEVAREILEQSPNTDVVNLSGRTSLRELCAAFTVCSFVLTNDTGPMHLAAAVGTPVIVPFGSTSEDLTGPGFHSSGNHKLISSDVPCAPCFLRECPIDFRCMRSITVERIVSEALKVPLKQHR